MRWRLALSLATTSLVAVAVSAQSSAFSERCWRLDGATLAVSALDSGCPVNVAIVDLTAPFNVGDDIPAIWTVSLNSASSNDLAMPTPSGALAVSTFLRTCETVASCDPTSTPAASSALQTANVSSDGVTFTSLAGVKFATEGVYPIAAFVTVSSSSSSSSSLSSYVFAAYVNVTVKKPVSNANAHERGVVHCRMSRQSALSSPLDPSATVSDSSNCELRINLSPLDVVTPNASSSVSWVATLDQHDDAEIHMPSPLSTALVDGVAYEIVDSSIKICTSESACDEYTNSSELEQVISVGPASFSSSGTARFTVSKLSLPTVGKHPAMVHMVLAGPNRRYDYVYYFDLLATATGDLSQQVETATYATDSTTSYCWDVLADGSQANVTAASVAVAAKDADCPYKSQLLLSADNVTTNGSLSLTWAIAATTNFSSAVFGAVDLTTVYDADSKAKVSLPILNVYACSNGTVCTPFASDKTLLASLPARNLTGNAMAIEANGITFPRVGNFTILVHTVFPNGASRIDTAVYGSVTVSASATDAATESKSKSHTVAYVLIAVACVVAVVGIFFGAVWLRKRRQRQRMDKMVQFGIFGAPRRDPTLLKTADSRGSGGTGHESFAFVKAQPSPFDSPRDGSPSYDLYRRSSFNEMSLEESNLSFAFTEGDQSHLSFAFPDGERRSSQEAYDV